MREHLVIGRHDDFDVLDVRIALQHGLGAQRDVVIGRRTALFRAVFRRGFGVQIQHVGENVGQQLAGCHRAVAANGMEADAERGLGQQARVGFGLERHQFGLGIAPCAVFPAAAAMRGVGFFEKNCEPR